MGLVGISNKFSLYSETQYSNKLELYERNGIIMGSLMGRLYLGDIANGMKSMKMQYGIIVFNVQV